jgi:hypothetical protein
MNLPHDYDDWRLSGPDDIHQPYVGTEEGDTCNRIAEPDEDAPRGYRPRPCSGTMHYGKVENCSCHINPPCGHCEDNPLVCDTCGEVAE